MTCQVASNLTGRKKRKIFGMKYFNLTGLDRLVRFVDFKVAGFDLTGFSLYLGISMISFYQES